MKLKLILCFCLSTVANAHFTEPILGGAVAMRYAYPNIVSVYSIRQRRPETLYIKPLFCGGTIYNKDWVAVTGLCASKIGPKRPIDTIRVAAGKWDITEPEPHEQLRSIVYFRIHGGFDKDQVGRSIDLSLLKLNTSLIFNAYVNAFPFSKKKRYPSGFGIIAGWGAATEQEVFNEHKSKILKVLGVDVIPYGSCKFAIRKFLLSKNLPLGPHYSNTFHFCTGTFTNDTVGPTMGDIGSPFLRATEGGLEVVGLISLGLIYPNLGLYIHTAPFMDWIERTLQRHAEP